MMMMMLMMVVMVMNGFVTRFCTPSTFQSSVQTSFYIFLYEAEINLKLKTAQWLTAYQLYLIG
jgi:hypothetical protein